MHPMAPALSASELLQVYDRHLRELSEVRGASKVSRLGPLWLAAYPGGKGFVSYATLDDLGSHDICGLVAAVKASYERDTSITSVEWKSRGHDRAPGLHDALVANGFMPEEEESIMLGDARLLAVDVEVPAEVTIRRVTSERDVRAMSAVQDTVFGGEVIKGNADELLRRLAHNDGMQLWVAEANGAVVCAGRLEPVEGTPFAGLWGGATVPEWRGRGVYRAMTAARARAALEAGKSYLHSDSNENSRPILERSGLVKASRTTPYVWNRPAGSA